MSKHYLYVVGDDKSFPLPLTVDSFGIKVYNEIVNQFNRPRKAHYNSEYLVFETDFIMFSLLDKNNYVQNLKVKCIMSIDISVLLYCETDLDGNLSYSNTYHTYHSLLKEYDNNIFANYIEQSLNLGFFINKLRKPKTFFERFKKPLCPEKINIESIIVQWSYEKIKEVFEKSDIKIKIHMVSGTSNYHKIIPIYNYLYLVKSCKSIDNVWNEYFKEGIKHLNIFL